MDALTSFAPVLLTGALFLIVFALLVASDTLARKLWTHETY